MAGSLLSIEDARRVVLEHVSPLRVERVAVGHEVLGRYLAEQVVTVNDVPPFDNSAMDGFVVTPGPANRTLTIAGESRAGAPATTPPREGEAVRVSTGAVVPPGDVGVVPVEQVTENGDGTITTTADVPPAQHIRRAGEDVRAKTPVLEPGTRLDAAALGVAVIAGRSELVVTRRPRVAIIATGDELAPPGTPLQPGQIHESNGVTLGALAQAAGAKVAVHRSVADTQEETERAFEGGLAAADVVIASGGVSVGPHDHVKPALEALGVQQRFWRVALRPGKPTWFGTRDGQLVFGLPGNPVSAMVTFLLFARPALIAMQQGDPTTTRLTAILTEAIPRNPGRDEAVRVRLDHTDHGARATPTGPQGSHQLMSMLGADGLAIVPAGEGEAAAGEQVDVEPLSGV